MGISQRFHGLISLMTPMTGDSDLLRKEKALAKSIGRLSENTVIGVIGVMGTCFQGFTGTKLTNASEAPEFFRRCQGRIGETQVDPRTHESFSGRSRRAPETFPETWTRTSERHRLVPSRPNDEADRPTSELGSFRRPESKEFTVTHEPAPCSPDDLDERLERLLARQEEIIKLLFPSVAATDTPAKRPSFRPCSLKLLRLWPFWISPDGQRWGFLSSESSKGRVGPEDDGFDWPDRVLHSARAAGVDLRLDTGVLLFRPRPERGNQPSGFADFMPFTLSDGQAVLAPTDWRGVPLTWDDLSSILQEEPAASPRSQSEDPSSGKGLLAAHIKHISSLVQSWPEWKRRILGGDPLRPSEFALIDPPPARPPSGGSAPCSEILAGGEPTFCSLGAESVIRIASPHGQIADLAEGAERASADKTTSPTSDLGARVDALMGRRVAPHWPRELFDLAENLEAGTLWTPDQTRAAVVGAVSALLSTFCAEFSLRWVNSSGETESLFYQDPEMAGEVSP